MAVATLRRVSTPSSELDREIHRRPIASLDGIRVVLEAALDGGDESIEERPNQHLAEVVDVGDRLEERLVRALPDERIGDDDRGRERRSGASTATDR